MAGGTTNSALLPLGGTQTYQKLTGGSSEAFLSSFDINNGSLLSGTYFGGAGAGIFCLAPDDANNQVYFGGFAGNTNIDISCNTPSSAGDLSLCSGGTGRYFQSNGGKGLVGSFNTYNSSLSWSTLFGGDDDDAFVMSIAVRNTGSDHSVFVGGWTNCVSPGGSSFPSPITIPSVTGKFPLADPGSGAYFQKTHLKSSGNEDGFVARFDNDHKLAWSTFFGGSHTDRVQKIALSAGGDLYIAGDTRSSTQASNSASANTTGAFPNFHTGAAHSQTSFGGDADYFISRFGGSQDLKWATYYGGPATESQTGSFPTTSSMGLAVSGNGDVFLGGTAFLGNSPLPAPSVAGKYDQRTNMDPGGSQGIIIEFDKNNVPVWNTFFGGVPNTSLASNDQRIDAIALGGSPDVTLYTSGLTNCINTPVSKLSITNSFFHDNTQLGGIYINRFTKSSTVAVGQGPVLANNGTPALIAIPNPSTGLFTVAFQSPTAMYGRLRIRLTNMIGIQLKDYSLPISGQNSSFSLDLSSYLPGVYLLSVEGGQGNAVTRIIKR